MTQRVDPHVTHHGAGPSHDPDERPDAVVAGAPLSERWTGHHQVAEWWDPPPLPTLAVVPHPDDEVLSMGGLIRRQCARRVPVTVLAVTDGEAAYEGVADLAALRRREQVSALGTLGLPQTAIRRMGLPDGRVADHEDKLRAAITRWSSSVGLIVAPWTGDHHTDHEATGRAAVAAATASSCPIVQSLFWTWHHADPADLPRSQMLALHLSDDERADRRAAMAAHTSQSTSQVSHPPVLSRPDLEPLQWRTEYYVDAARIDNGRRERS